MTITIVNCRKQKPDIYCGRAYKGYPASPLGNPFPMASEADRDVVIEKYRRWLWKKIKAHDLNVLYALRLILDRASSESVPRPPVNLGCWCAPKRCHCECIISALRSERVLAILDEWMPF